MKRRLVLKTPASRDALLRHFYQRSWNYIREHQPTEGDPRPHQIAWTRGAKREHRVDWFDDRAVDLQFFEISTDTPEPDPLNGT
jgi:hypothetical protein